MYRTIAINKDARGVATLTLNRPDKHNAMSARMLQDLTAAAADLNADDGVRVVVLTGAGKSFCAGGDLGWMRDQMGMDAATRRAEARKLADMLNALDKLSKPLIGAVQGNAFGGGVGLACVCDVVVAASGAKLGLTETRLGLIPATIGPYVVARMGEGRARQVFMSARVFDAQEAVALGIVSKAVPPEALWDAVDAEVLPYLDAAPEAVAAAKKLVRDLGGAVSREAIDMSIEALSARWDSAEAQEGIEAFFAKRKAAWMRGA